MARWMRVEEPSLCGSVDGSKARPIYVSFPAGRRSWPISAPVGHSDHGSHVAGATLPGDRKGPALGPGLRQARHPGDLSHAAASPLGLLPPPPPSIPPLGPDSDP